MFNNYLMEIKGKMWKFTFTGGIFANSAMRSSLLHFHLPVPLDEPFLNK